MELLPKSLRNKIPGFHEQGYNKVGDAKVYCKFFTPWAYWTWYVLEAETEEDDTLFYGFVIGHEKEFGYFSLNELESVRSPHGLKIERDLHFKPCKLREVPEYAQTLHRIG